MSFVDYFGVCLIVFIGYCFYLVKAIQDFQFNRSMIRKIFKIPFAEWGGCFYNLVKSLQAIIEGKANN